MSRAIFIGVAVTFVSWGLGSFVAKMAADRIGTQSVFWDLLGALPWLLVYYFVLFKERGLFLEDRTGVGLAVLAGVIGSVGSVSFYYVLSKSEASVMIPLTALYPALTAVLAIIFLHESITLTKIWGIALSLAAIYLLSK